MKTYSAITLFALFCLLGCSKSNTECCVYPDQFSDFIFGTYYGECMGKGCIETFRLKDEKLYEDQKDSYGGPFPYPGEWTALDNDKYELVKFLPNAFPFALLDETETTIGMPDAGDWGGIYIEVETTKGNRYYWNIDTMEENLPEYLREFAAEVQEAVMKIND